MRQNIIIHSTYVLKHKILTSDFSQSKGGKNVNRCLIALLSAPKHMKIGKILADEKDFADKHTATHFYRVLTDNQEGFQW